MNKHISNLAIDSVRYALPRSTVAPGEVIAAVKAFWTEIDPRIQMQIVKEICRDLPRLNLPVDIKEEWQMFIDWVAES